MRVVKGAPSAVVASAVVKATTKAKQLIDEKKKGFFKGAISDEKNNEIHIVGDQIVH
jgi:hypothetical protein